MAVPNTGLDVVDRNVLLVEGPDELNVLRRLLEHHGIPFGAIRIKNKEGVDRLINRQQITNEIRAGGLERLGIIVDADTQRDLASRWASIRDTLRSLGYSGVPPSPAREGTIVEHDTEAAVGIWIMPDNSTTGMLEHFIGSLIPRGDRLWPRARRSVSLIRSSDQRFRESYRIKAQMHTWLAWQEEPGTPLGAAITKRYLDADAPPAQRLITWIHRLFQV